jgi:hypothetical protein
MSDAAQFSLPESLPEITVIKRRPRKPSASQTEKEQQACFNRVRRNRADFEQMKRVLTVVTRGRMTMSSLLDLAHKIAAPKHLTIDRAARRMKDCLICWFCENFTPAGSSVNDLGANVAQMEQATQSGRPSCDPFGVEPEEWFWRFESEEGR